MSFFSYIVTILQNTERKLLYKRIFIILNFRHFSFHRRFGTKCSGCSQGISPTDLVRRARNKVFHLKCFTCLVCRKQLSTGEELYVLDENRFICKEDYLSSRHSQGKNISILKSFTSRKITQTGTFWF